MQLNNGFLPGSADVSAAASTTPGRGRFERTTLPPYLRSSIQIAIAATIAVVVGDAVDGFRLYWAVLAAFLAFMATTNTGEQVRKALFRVAGTAVGIVVGDLLVHVTGGNVWAALPIVLVVLFLGIYLIRVNYTFMVIGITMMLSLLYYQLGEFSWHLLVLRLGETAVGVGAVVVTVLVVFPLRPQRVLTAGVLLWFRSLSALLDAALDRLSGGRPHATCARRSATSTRRGPRSRRPRSRCGTPPSVASPPNWPRSGRSARRRGSTRARWPTPSAASRRPSDPSCVPPRRTCGRPPQPSRSGSRPDSTASTCAPGRSSTTRPAPCRPPLDPSVALALRDLTMLDGALARLAAALDMQVRDHDTTDLVDAPSPHQPLATT